MEEKTPKKNILKRFGWGVIIFFIVKGTISTILIYYTGKGIWTWLGNMF